MNGIVLDEPLRGRELSQPPRRVGLGVVDFSREPVCTVSAIGNLGS